MVVVSKKVKTIFSVEGENIPEGFIVEVKCIDEKHYVGRANYSIRRPGIATPYKSITTSLTEENALQDAITGFESFGLYSYPSEFIFWGKDGQYYNCQSEIVSENDIQKKFKEYSMGHTDVN